jgi:hypothetical protein
VDCSARPPEMNKCSSVGRSHQQKRIELSMLIARHVHQR